VIHEAWATPKSPTVDSAIVGGMDMPTVTPYLLYADVESALEFLSRAYGFETIDQETTRNDDGAIVHSAMAIGSGMVMMGCPGKGYQNPKALGHVTQNVYVYVDDVEAHYARAKEAGAEILAELEDTHYGDRRYGTVDPEGHHWYFAEAPNDVAPKTAG